MSEKKISINTLLANPESLIEDDCCSFFHDWFCDDSKLDKRALALTKKLRVFVDEGLIDGDKNYVWFKNNCPMSGSLYDDMRISNIETGAFLGGICPSCGHNSSKGEASIWFLGGEYKNGTHYVIESSWAKLKRNIRSDESVRSMIRSHFNAVSDNAEPKTVHDA